MTERSFRVSILAVAVLLLCGAYAFGQSAYVVPPHPVTTRATTTSKGIAALTVTTTQHTLRTAFTQGTLVTYEGILRLVYVDSGRDIPAEPVLYLEMEEHKYRLIAVDFFMFADGTHVRVTGTLVVPSSWSRPYPLFDGDIFVQRITAL